MRKPSPIALIWLLLGVLALVAIAVGYAILHGPLPPKLAVPDGQLPVEVPERGKGSEINAIGSCRGPHGEVGSGDLQVQAATRVGKLGEVVARPAGQLLQSKEFRHGGMVPGPRRPRGPANLRT